MLADAASLMEENAHRQALEAMWRERLVNTRTRYEAAKATVQAARELQSQIPSPDGNFALVHALGAENRALAEFNRVLIIFVDLVLHGKAPEED